MPIPTTQTPPFRELVWKLAQSLYDLKNFAGSEQSELRSILQEDAAKSFLSNNDRQDMSQHDAGKQAKVTELTRGFLAAMSAVKSVIGDEDESICSGPFIVLPGSGVPQSPSFWLLDQAHKVAGGIETLCKGDHAVTASYWNQLRRELQQQDFPLSQDFRVLLDQALEMRAAKPLHASPTSTGVPAKPKQYLWNWAEIATRLGLRHRGGAASHSPAK